MDLELDGKAFLITGGTDGLGLALAAALVKEGARVGVCGRDPDRLEHARAVLGDSGHCVAADVTSESQLDAFVDGVVERFGRLDGVVNNAGRTAGWPVSGSTDQQWRDDYELKVIAAVHVARRSLEHLRATGGSILNVLAILARTPGANSTPTSASRAAGLAFTKALSQEVAGDGVRVNAILIGLIESGQWVRRAREAGTPLEDFYASLATSMKIPLGRVGYEREFADVATFLLSPRASYVTGIGVSVDGGLSPTI